MKQRAVMLAITAAFLTCVCSMPISTMAPSLFNLTGWAACPAGTTIDVSKRPLAERSGYRVMVVCLEPDGDRVEANQTLGFIALFGMFFLAFFVLGMIISVISGLRPAKAPEPPPALATPLLLDQEYELQQLIRSGKQIHAIKRLRDITGLGLAQAKAHIDYMQAQLPPAGATPASPAPPPQRPAAAVPQQQAAAHSDVDAGIKSKLRELKDLLDSGLITSADYESKKQELLSRM